MILLISLLVLTLFIIVSIYLTLTNEYTSPEFKTIVTAVNVFCWLSVSLSLILLLAEKPHQDDIIVINPRHRNTLPILE